MKIPHFLKALAAPAAPPSGQSAGVSVDYEAMLEAFYRQLPLEGTEIVDVGAHLGRHALPLARLAGIGGTVHAFEPIPAIRRQLSESVAAEGLNNVVVYPFALAAEPRVAQFIFVPNLPEESGLRKRHTYSYNAVPSGFVEIPVKVMRLQDALPASSRPRFIKIDVEGGELDVLRGSIGVLDAARPIVAFECGACSYQGYHEKPDEIFEIFRSRGYSVHSITGIAIADVEVFRNASLAQVFWDYVALPEADSRFARLLKGG